ncbi:sensor histidine kinase [Nocardioides sp. MH1]|uniref:sensor histidine kinase n=1 Tax=Nocardioides sp. MH1 TaxID=3242490 RepID=UPI0035229EA3
MTELVVTSEIHALVRVSYLLRMLTLLVCMLGFVDQALAPEAVVAIIFLTLTSMAGISIPSAPEVLDKHPILVVLDGLLMTALMVALGTDNPLVLGALSSCVVLGVVLPLVPAVLSTFVMVAGYLTASLSDHSQERMFMSDFGYPITFISVVAIGQVFRVLAQRKRQSERAMADLVTGAAAAAERARLARELHDSTAKTLQGMVLTARSLDHWIEHDPTRAATEAKELAESADEAVVRLRSLLSTLRQDDNEQAFHESLATLARDGTQGTGVRLKLDLDPVTVSAPGVRYELLAAAREAIANAVTHSGADQVTVALSSEEEELCIEVVDQGRGFSLDILPGRELDGHFGVRGYSERLALIGGAAEVTSRPGKGTRVKLVAPLMGLREEARG